jgi:hypothetical protein
MLDFARRVWEHERLHNVLLTTGDGCCSPGRHRTEGSLSTAPGRCDLLRKAAPRV